VLTGKGSKFVRKFIKLDSFVRTALNAFRLDGLQAYTLVSTIDEYLI